MIADERIFSKPIRGLNRWSTGVLSLCFILLIKLINNYGLRTFATVSRRFGLIPASLDTFNTSLYVNPNSLGKFVVLSVFCLLSVLKYEEKHGMRIVAYITCLLTFGLMSGSRAFLLVFSLLATIYALEVFLNFRSNKRIAMTMLAAALVVSFFIFSYMDSTVDMLNKRLASEDVSGGRFGIYQEYIDQLKGSFYLLFGSGMQEYPKKYNIGASSHNLFVEVISMWGLIGLVIVGVWFISLYKALNLSKHVSKSGRSMLHYLPLIGLFLHAQVGQFFLSYYSTLPTLILAYMTVNYGHDKQNLKSDLPEHIA